MNINTFASRSLALVAFALLPATANAGAVYFPEMSSVSESGYAGAGMVARANDAGTVFSNPAGMTRFSKPEIMTGGIGVFIPLGFDTSPNNTVDGSSRGINKRVVPAGSFAYVRPLSNRLKVGISAHNYFGLALDWDDSWVGRYSSVNVAVMAPQVQPTVAYKVNDWLSVGAGAAVTMGYVSDKMRVKSIPPGGDDGKLRYSDTDFAVQYNFGLMFEPWKHTRIGIRYLTETDLDFNDSPNVSGITLPDPDPNVAFTSPADGLKTRIKMPQSIHAAIYHQWNDKIALLGSIGWEEFSAFGKIQIGLDNTGITTTVDADFRDVWHFGVGSEYKFKPKWEVTTGLSLDSSMSTDRTRPIVIPLGTLYRYAIGVKHQKRKDLILGAGLTFIWEGNLPIKNTGGVSGKYDDVSIWIASVYARWH